MDSLYERAKCDLQYHAEIMDHLHHNPELSFEEIETTRFIRNKLDEYGIEQIPLGIKTGAAGIIRTGKPGKTILLRADIDALKSRKTLRWTSFPARPESCTPAAMTSTPPVYWVLQSISPNCAIS